MIEYGLQRLNEINTDNALNLDKILSLQRVDLSIIKPPYYNLKDDPTKHIELIKKTVEKS